MQPLSFQNISLYDIKGVRHVADGNASAEIRAEAIDGGYAYYVSASFPEGFSAPCAVSFSPCLPDTSDFLAINAHSDYWSRPFWGNSLSELPRRIQELLIRDGDRYLCLLPVVDDTYKSLFRGCDGGFECYLYANVDGMTECDNQLSFLCLEGSDPQALLRKTAESAARLLGTGMKMREEREVSPIFEYLGWCSWDALQTRINHADMVKKAEEFREKGVPVGFAIYDDMWADAPLLAYIEDSMTRRETFRTMHASTLRSFEGDPKRFPKGMKAAVDDLRAAGIPYIGVWFPTTGYWAGLQPGGEIADELRDVTVLTEEKRQIIAAPEEGKAAVYFDTLCRRAKEWGADFVKIDNQGYHTRYVNLAPIGQSARAIQHAIDGAAAEHFGGALINCMGMPSECMYNRRDSAVSRCSDDFQPESREWFAKNILQCAYNGLLQGQYYVNDWDMWWTDDEQAQKNSLCRAISGGPIYVSDKIGRTRPEVLRPLILKDGHVLRPCDSARPTADCLMENPTTSGKVFKIYNRIGRGTVAAVFNIDAENRALSGVLRPSDTGLPAGTYVYYEHFSGACGECTADGAIEVTLAHNDEFRLYTFLPKGERFTVIGRTDLYMGAKAVVSLAGDRVTLAEGGDTAVYSDAPVTVFAGGQEIPAIRTGRLTRFSLASDVTDIEIRSLPYRKEKEHHAAASRNF
ncbi:MAG: hypothetical protein J6B77_09850 [Clostridia bacterium]|nr:hypothetical protein [Clostridia bacterium]